MTTASKYLRIPRFESIRSKILAFALVATLLPTSITLWISYRETRAVLEANTAQSLLSQSAQTAREMGVWLKERLYDLRVFASSYEVSDDLARGATAVADEPTRGRLHDYLRSLQQRFGDFEQLLVVDPQGRLVATSAATVAPVRLPGDWMKVLRTERQLVGDAYWDRSAGRGKLLVAIPVQRPNGQIIGGLVAEVSISALQRVLGVLAPDTVVTIQLATADGALIASSREVSPRLLSRSLERRVLERLTRQEGRVLSYASGGHGRVVGTLKAVPQVRWAVVAEIPVRVAFRRALDFRNNALVVVALLLVIAAALAYRLGLVIVRPLDRLIKGAGEVAAGDLAVDLPTTVGGEVGYLTTVFNRMVWHLRENRRELDETNEKLRRQNEELEHLSMMDSLTGLANRRYLVQRLTEEARLFGRTMQPFTVLMADVDHFKKYNDVFGHPAGDELLKRIADLLRGIARESDCVARYGGDEFCLLLPHTAGSDGAHLAERIRGRIALEEFNGERITLSIGAASLPADGITPEAVIAAADEALYRAKREGRNRVVQCRGG